MKRALGVARNVLAAIGLLVIVFCVWQVRFVTHSRGKELVTERLKEMTTFKFDLDPSDRCVADFWRLQEQAERNPDMYDTRVIVVLGGG